MILSGNIDSSSWASVRFFVREGEEKKADAMVRYGLRGFAFSDRDVADTLAHARRLEAID